MTKATEDYLYAFAPFCKCGCLPMDGFLIDPESGTAQVTKRVFRLDNGDRKTEEVHDGEVRHLTLDKYSYLALGEIIQ